MPFTERKGVLLASANPSREHYLDQLEQEVEAIYNILSAPGLESKIAVFEETRMKLSRIFSRFNNRYAGKVHMVHYCGHSDEEKIFLEKPGTIATHAMDVGDFANFLKSQPDVEVVFLNSCSSYILGELLLKHSNIQAVIETTQQVTDIEAATFAISFYTLLANGKNLEQSFEVASIKHRADFEGEYEKVEVTRGIGFEKSDGSEWRLSFKEEGNKWRLFPATVMDRLNDLPEETVKVLCYLSEKEEAYYNALKASFSNEDIVFFYHFQEVLSEVKGKENQIACLEASDAHCLMLSPTLIEYWKEHAGEECFQSVTHKPTVLISCKGDTEQYASFLNRQGAFPAKKTIRAPVDFTLEEIAQLRGRNLERIFNQFCRKDLETLLFTNEKELAAHLINLNFNHQKEQYDVHFIHQKRVFLVLLEGTPYCAQEVLIKALSRLPDSYLDLEELDIAQLSLRACFPNGGVTTELLLEEVKRTLAPPPYPSNFEGLMEIIRQRLTYQDVVFILNDIDLTLYPKLPEILNATWKEISRIVDNWAHTPPKRLYFFILNKSEEMNFPKGTFIPPAENSPCHTLLLDRIECLGEHEFNKWHGNASNLIPQYSSFHSLRTRKGEILEKKYMSYIISEICRILKRPAVSEKVLSF